MYWHEKNGLEDLKTANSIHLILDLQDVSWYMSQVHFKTPQVKSFFSQRDHFEYSQVAVKQSVQEEEALVTGGYWQVDGLRRELIRHHKDKRQNLLRQLQFRKIIFLMREKLTLSSRRARRRFPTRTTGAL